MGMGLKGFLNNNPSSGGGRRGSFLSWKDKGSVVVWLHTASDIHFAYVHQFMFEDEFEDKETGKMRPTLRFPRFVSPEPLEVLQKQFFRDRATGRLEHMPSIDPFLLLREWIRAGVQGGSLAPETVVFEWHDPKNSKLIQWRAGDLSGLEKRGKMQWNHSLDAKLQYTMLVVDDSNTGAGIQIAQETQAIGDKLREEIRRQIESRGEEAGDPTTEPYAFKWKFDEGEKNPNNMYSVFRYDKAVCTDEVWKLIAETEAQDLRRLTTPQDGDMAKIRAGFEQAQRIDLPIAAIFSEDERERRAVAEGRTGGTMSRSATGTSRTGGAPSVPASTGGARRPGASQPAQGAEERRAGGSPAPSSSTPSVAPQTRRRRVEEPKPPPPPVEETIPCDDCGAPMSPKASTCAKCGATYDVEEDAGAPPPKPMPGSGPRRPSASQQQADAVEDSRGSGADPCWSCGSTDIRAGKCGACGMTQDVDGGDDLPF